MVSGLKDGSIKASDIPAIRTLQRNGQTISIDNRRLLGTELEDIDSLLPKRLSSNLNQMSELALDDLKKMPKVDSAQSAWYDQLL